MQAKGSLVEFVPTAEQLRAAHGLAGFFLHGCGLLNLGVLAGMNVGQIEALSALVSSPGMRRSGVLIPDLAGNLVTLGVDGARVWSVRPDGAVVFGLGAPSCS